MNDEDRLRELLRDPRWSLAPWPDAQSRVRRAAKRQRRAAAGVAGAMAVIVAAAAAFTLVVVLGSSPAKLPGRQPALAGSSSRPAPASSPSVAVKPTALPSTPAIGSAAFPASIYPAPKEPRMTTGTLALCPDPAGLEDPGPYTAAAARTVLSALGRGLTGDLRVSDRSAWPFLADRGKLGDNTLLTYARTPVRFAGPLQAGLGVPAHLRRAVAAGCGTRVARATWVLSFRLGREPALQAVMLFVTRRGHMLFYGLI
ncbi:MAG TPA: hypothetical protein VHJ18_10760 [Streptosporangiaceae bacterium]|nr:hypothetical protein [Streptosporangiaceae bacterium]